MAITFEPVRITVDRAGAALNGDNDSDETRIHLTRGFVGVKAKQQKDAFVISAEVDALVDQPAEADALVNGPWRFGFVQIARTKQLTFTWSGRVPTEGEVVLALSVPPAWPPDKLVSYDANPLNRPLMSAGPHLGSRTPAGAKIRVELANSMGDHPNHRSPLTVPNSVTKTTNFISAIDREFEAFSIFFARDPAQKFHHLAHVHWTVNAFARYRWRGRKPEKPTVTGDLTFDLPVQGPPVDPEVVPLLETPGPPFHNDTADQAVLAANNHLNLRELPKRGLLIKKDFFL